MFEKICIKSKELSNRTLDIPFLIDTMLFYRQVIVLVHKKEITKLLHYFGENLLKELIITGRIELKIRENILGSMIFPEDRYNIDLFAGKEDNISSILYQAHREIVNNSSKNLKFSNEFSKLTESFKYNSDLTNQIIGDFENNDLLKKLLPIYVDSRVPNFELPKDLQIDIIKDNKFGPFDAYSLKSNIDVAKFNSLSKEINGKDHHDFNYSGFLLALSESKGDIYIASHFDSELVTTPLYSDFINQQFNEIIQKRLNSQDNIDAFEEYILANCYSIGDAFVNGLVSKKELLKLFEKADNFRDWLLAVPENKSLIGEYHLAVTKETFADKLPTKATRFVIFEGIGLALDAMGAGGIGTVLGTGLSAFDSFYLDKLIQGWKPNQFVDNNLKPILKKK